MQTVTAGSAMSLLRRYMKHLTRLMQTPMFRLRISMRMATERWTPSQSFIPDMAPNGAGPILRESRCMTGSGPTSGRCVDLNTGTAAKVSE